MAALNDFYAWFAAGAGLVLAGIASSLVARRFGTPLLLVFLGIGMLAGADGPGGIRFSDYSGTYRFGSLALAVILFDGGLRTQLTALRKVLAPALLLATLGVALSALATGLAAGWLLGVDTSTGFLVGAAVASTDAAATLFLLRKGGVQLREKVSLTLEVESSGNDPAAILLTLLVVGWLLRPAETSAVQLGGDFLRQFGIGLGAGLAGGLAIAWGLARLPLGQALSPLFALAGAVAVFGAAGYLGGSGFVAVFVAGVLVGNRVSRGRTPLLATLEAFTWLCQIGMFLVLGLLVSPQRMAGVLGPALMVALFLMFVGRPLAVALCLVPLRRYSAAETTYIGWVGLRGAVGIFLASIPMITGLPNAMLVFNTAFVVVLATLLLQGWTLAPVARLLGVALRHREPPVRRSQLDLPGHLSRDLIGWPVVAGARILEQPRLPAWAQLTLVVRGEQILAPGEAGALQVGDYAYLTLPAEQAGKLDWLFAPPARAGEAERELFGGFSLDGGVTLRELTDFYGLPLPALRQDHSLGELFAEQFGPAVEMGDELPLGAVTLVARRLDGERVAAVGLRIHGRLARRTGGLRRLYRRWRGLPGG